jgi:hypothetical protein
MVAICDLDRCAHWKTASLHNGSLNLFGRGARIPSDLPAAMCSFPVQRNVDLTPRCNDAQVCTVIELVRVLEWRELILGTCLRDQELLVVEHLQSRSQLRYAETWRRHWQLPKHLVAVRVVHEETPCVSM